MGRRGFRSVVRVQKRLLVRTSANAATELGGWLVNHRKKTEDRVDERREASDG